MVFTRGQSAVIVPVPAANPVVGRWRARLDPAATAGVPAHVTVIYPFLHEDGLTGDVVADLRRLVADHPAFSVAFAAFATFPGVLFLAPEPDDPFRRLTADLAERWPEARPYGGAFPDTVPHLTVAHGATPSQAAIAETDIAAGLPITTRIDHAALIVFDGKTWSLHTGLPLGLAGE